MKILTYDNKVISNPPNGIIPYDKNFTFQQPVTLFLEQFLEEPKTSKYDFVVTDNKDVEYFKCLKTSPSRIVVHDINDKILFNIQIRAFPLQISVHAGDDDKTTLAVCHSKASTVAEKCVFEFYNQVTEQTETVDMNCDKYYCSGGIFYGTEKEGAPMICRLREMMDANSFMTHLNKKFIIEIAAGVDNTLMIALAIYFAEMNYHSRKNRKNFSDLTR
ncbi:hypothetical protein BCR32DRAFT_325069 [Anaeromyces robustus]|uniref:DUF567-domain-containing protein n=1 Tax=Anaeromyces robustus TaxID=1754192 RepID=A0A1Y1XKD7_9FUNG|nr:hypothetical protein BCR32DRAFT_325069 [Anaeromyces robustus]|eukprot:ORX86175.1 hypothetical protein BCR32DRAFT_325069 [Anaeromyces robustus]